MKPRTFAEIFQFYYEYVKPLYSRVQLTNTLPVEVLFEVNAALDHISRHWQYNETEQQAVEKAYAHLKRSCLDIFKLTVKEAIDRAAELSSVDTSIIDNGRFDRELVALVARIKQSAMTARLQEGDARKDDQAAILAFELWSPVYDDCVKLEKDFYLNEHVTWARKKERRGKWTERAIGAGFSLALFVITQLIRHYFFREKP
jgi:hypothetical protein